MHQIFTFMAPLVPARQAPLEAYLDEIRLAVPHHPDLPFADLRKIHFASIVIVPGDAAFPAYLVFENNIDGTIPAYVAQLCSQAATGLHRMFGACVGYDAESAEVGALRAFLLRHLRRPNASFVGNVGRNLERIENERRLVEDIGHETDRLLAQPQGRASENLYRDLRSHAAGTNAWALQPKARLSAAATLERKARLGAVAVVALLVWPVLVAGAVVLRWKEVFDAEDTIALELTDATTATQHEDYFHQNHFASISTVKPGWFRRTLLRVVLVAIDRVAGVSLDGTLSNLDNIHFAHWVLIDDGRRLLFVTNYDGSWENYLDDFIDKAAAGLTAIWSNVCGFPKTRFLVFGGATDERKFKTIARRTQIPTAVWYSAYLELTVPTIENDSAIRDGLATPPEGAGIDRWLQRL